MDVSVLIISYNTRELTLACIASAIEQTAAGTYEIIVVDNSSKDGSAQAIAEQYPPDQFPQIRLIALDRNLGFAGANNHAATFASGEFLLLLNPDTVVLDHAIDHAVMFAKADRTIGIVGGRTLFGDRRLNPNSCHGRPTPWSLFCMGFGLSSAFRRNRLFDPESLGKWPRDTIRRVDAVTGCFLLIETALWRTLGGFDLDFFMYSEDTDLCLRCWKLGRPCVIDPAAVIIHYGAQSEKIRPDKMIRLFRAKAQIFQKHWPSFFVGFGLKMLELWALSRTIATYIRQRFNPGGRDAFQSWREIWRRRREFRPGAVSAAIGTTVAAIPAATLANPAKAVAADCR